MKRFEPIESKLVAARRTSENNDVFVDQVMDAIETRATNRRVIRTTNEQLNKETFIMKLRKLPAIALIAIVLAAMIGLGGVSYAAVKLIESNKPAVKETHVNQKGKTELTTEANACRDLEQTRSERYELKEGIGLSAGEAAKYINAHCHLLLINERLSLQGWMLASGMPGGVITGIQDGIVSIRMNDKLYESRDGVDFYDHDLRQISLSDFKVGDTVLVYRDMRPGSTDSPVKGIFKPVEALKYYDASMQQNIRTVKPCLNNERMDCVVPSNYNAVTLIVSQGGSVVPAQPASKDMQGKLVEHANDHFTLENNGHKVTFQTPYDIVARYNQTTVHGLAGLESIYANTDPEVLKIVVGDSLSLFYAADSNETTIPWSNVGVITLMVEREPADTSVLRKY